MRWRTTELGTVCETITKGTTPRTLGMEYVPDGIPFLRAENLQGGEVSINGGVLFIDEKTDRALARSRIKPGDVLLSIAGTVGRCAIAPSNAPPMNCNQAVAIIRLASSLDGKFALHWLQSPDAQRQMTSAKVSMTISNLSLSQISVLRIPVPPLSEQKHVAAILDRADAVRVKRRRAMLTLDMLTRSIFLDMFGDPVSNPKKWPGGTLGESLIFQQYGPRFYNEPYSSDGERIVRITDLSEEGVLDFSSMPRLAVSDKDREKYSLRPGDILFARSGATVGKVALIKSEDPSCIAGAYFITMRFKASIVPIYARAVLTSSSVRAIVTKRSRQAAQQNFSGPGLRELPMPVPPIRLQREFARRVTRVEKLKEEQRSSLAKMDELFASLQHRAFRGEL